VEKVTVDTPLVFFVVPAGLDLITVFEKANAEAILNLLTANMANSLGKVSELFRRWSERGSIDSPVIETR
jgi:hypothetical protein